MLPSGSGVRKPPLFFLDCLRSKRNDLDSAAALALPTQEADDVARERAFAENLVVGGAAAAGSSFPIIAHQLGKVYPGQDGAAPKLACQNFSLAIPRGECFGLLGPNGAGKSTSINMLIGFLQPTSGTAIIEGLDIRHDMDTIYTLLGVCPQHDLLWETLTAREHLEFYGRLKNLRGAELRAECDKALQSVNLYANGTGERAVGGFSGGMKRRLSVAISFIGDPLVVFLDEPSTGLDPASRAQLWEVVKRAKKDRAIVLTTHSMEEAEELCDRLGIFVDGALRCIGNPKELTSRYGGFLILTITCAPKEVQRVAEFVTSKLASGAVCTYSLGGMQRFDLPTSQTDLASIFKAVEIAKRDMNITDWAVANMTLEEVFIKLSREIGAQTRE